MLAMDAFFVPVGSELHPSPEARSPWSDEMLHGRLLAALAARAVERDQVPEGMVPARITVDLFRAAPLRPVQLETTVRRDGRRVRVVECRIRCEGEDVAWASVLILRQGAAPEGRVWSPEPWRVPLPQELAEPEPLPAGGARFPIDIRRLGGAQSTDSFFGGSGPRQAWVREARYLVAGEEPSPFVRAVAAADLANPFANGGEQGLSFINADLSVYLGRLPVGDWIGLEVTNHIMDSGVAVGSCDLYDTSGRLGTATVASVANPRMRS
jgi:hypothetical protein